MDDSSRGFPLTEDGIRQPSKLLSSRYGHGLGVILSTSIPES